MSNIFKLKAESEMFAAPSWALPSAWRLLGRTAGPAECTQSRLRFHMGHGRMICLTEGNSCFPRCVSCSPFHQVATTCQDQDLPISPLWGLAWPRSEAKQAWEKPPSLVWLEILTYLLASEQLSTTLSQAQDMRLRGCGAEMSEGPNAQRGGASAPAQGLEPQ